MILGFLFSCKFLCIKLIIKELLVKQILYPSDLKKLARREQLSRGSVRRVHDR